MTEFEKYLRDNREAIYSEAMAATPCNEFGEPVITKDDPWRYEDVWDRDYEELVRAERESINTVREA